MRLKLQVISGPSQGQEFLLAENQTLGRANSDIIIDDPKVSGRHAKIEKDSQSGALYLIDLGSTNGLRVNGRAAKKIEISPGIKIRIGNSEVLISAEALDEPPPPLPPPDDNLTLPPVKAVPVEKKEEPVTWDTYFTSFCLRSVDKIENPRAVEILPFAPMLTLSIVRGLQIGTIWTMGYGPRQIGLNSLEFCLFEPGTPLIAFSVEPRAQLALFKTQHSDQVLLNGRAISSEILKAGDQISIAGTLIKVSYKP